MISVSISKYGSNGKLHTGIHKLMFIEEIIQMCENSNKINNFGNVNGVCVLHDTDGKYYIFQVSGYSEERGLFCDLILIN